MSSGRAPSPRAISATRPRPRTTCRALYDASGLRRSSRLARLARRQYRAGESLHAWSSRRFTKLAPESSGSGTDRRGARSRIDSRPIRVVEGGVCETGWGARLERLPWRGRARCSCPAPSRTWWPDRASGSPNAGRTPSRASLMNGGCSRSSTSCRSIGRRARRMGGDRARVVPHRVHRAPWRGGAPQRPVAPSPHPRK